MYHKLIFTGTTITVSIKMAPIPRITNTKWSCTSCTRIRARSIVHLTISWLRGAALRISVQIAKCHHKLDLGPIRVLFQLASDPAAGTASFGRVDVRHGRPGATFGAHGHRPPAPT